MFRLSFKVSGERLGDVINSVNKFVTDISVIPLKASDTSQPARTTPRKHKSRKKYGPRKHGPNSLVNRCAQIIHKFGLQPVPLTEFRSAVRSNGIHDRHIYEALRQEIEAGRLVKLKPGLYKRTGSSFSQEMAVAN